MTQQCLGLLFVKLKLPVLHLSQRIPELLYLNLVFGFQLGGGQIKLKFAFRHLLNSLLQTVILFLDNFQEFYLLFTGLLYCLQLRIYFFPLVPSLLKLFN